MNARALSGAGSDVEEAPERARDRVRETGLRQRLLTAGVQFGQLAVGRASQLARFAE